MSELKHFSTVELSIRRKNMVGLPGDDPTLHNLKIGSALKAKSNTPLRGLEYEEEVKYLPEIIGYAPSDTEWRKMTSEYWNNISVPIPADGLTPEKLQGKILTFKVGFVNESDKKAFDSVFDFEEKANILKKLNSDNKCEVVTGVNDYILFRYCLVYKKVANKIEDVNKSPRIQFYLYSKQNEIKTNHQAFKARVQANNKFAEILMKEDIINAVLLLFGQDVKAFEDLQEKHIVLEGLIKQDPAKFLSFVEDSNLEIKAKIKKAVELRIIHSPVHTDSYYYGDNNEVLLGTTLTDAVLFWNNDKNKEIIGVIESRLKNS